MRVRAKLTQHQADQSQAVLRVQNVAGARKPYEIQWKVLDYFQEVVAEGQETVELDDRQAWEQRVAVAHGRSDRYRVVLSATDETGHAESDVSEVFVDGQISPTRGKYWLNEGWRYRGYGLEH